MSRIAVIVIDVQQKLFSGQTAAHRADDMIDGINRVTDAARCQNVAVFFVQHESDANGPLAHGSDAWRADPRA